MKPQLEVPSVTDVVINLPSVSGFKHVPIKFPSFGSFFPIMFSQQEEEQVFMRNIKNILQLKATLLLQVKQERNGS